MGRLRKLDGDRSDVPFLVLTADATQQTRCRAFSAGAHELLTKPIDRIELLLRVRDLLHAEQVANRPCDAARFEDELETLDRPMRAA